MEKQRHDGSGGTPKQMGGPRTYKMSFPEKEVPRRCPVTGCPGDLATWTVMWVHFIHRHVQNTVVMLEEGSLPLPWFPRCDLLVSRKVLNGRHLGTIHCRMETERKRRRLAEAEI